MAASTRLTPYDTGRAAQPIVWDPTPLPDPMESRTPEHYGKTLEEATDTWGRVDFENDEGSQVVGVHVHRPDPEGPWIIEVIPTFDVEVRVLTS